MQTTVESSISQRLLWRSLIADIVLAGLASGPVAAPFLAASGLPLLPLIADIIYWMGMHVCPQPEMGIALMPPQIMAVCMRCYGTVTGLVVMRWLYRQELARKESRCSRYWLHQYGVSGFALTVLLCLVYPAELYAQNWGWWGYHNWVVFPFGLVSGLGLGAYIMPLLHRRTQPVDG
ncbi:MAG: DUF2085 domain-containing protein [Cyanobacteria bacterium P01_G01_bin.38]